MDKWVKNIIGLSIAIVVLVFGWRFFTGSEGTLSIWEGKVSVKSQPVNLQAKSEPPKGFVRNRDITLLTPIEKATTPETSSPPIEIVQKLLSCRLPSHGIEVYEKSQEWTTDSGWKKGGPSRSAFCEAQRVNRIKKFPDRVVKLLSAKTSHKSKYTPFKNDYYRHLCTYKDVWDPIYNLKENKECAEDENEQAIKAE